MVVAVEHLVHCGTYALTAEAIAAEARHALERKAKGP
jgi:hypothetical protein